MGRVRDMKLGAMCTEDIHEASLGVSAEGGVGGPRPGPPVPSEDGGPRTERRQTQCQVGAEEQSAAFRAAAGPVHHSEHHKLDVTEQVS